jgi:hypothetical protein
MPFAQAEIKQDAQYVYEYASLNDGDTSLDEFIVVRTCTYTNLDSAV